MSWTDPDVQPVGLERGADSAPPPPRVIHHRGRVRLGLGFAAIALAVIATAIAAIGFLADQSGLVDDAVARGEVGGGAVRFDATAEKHTVLILTPERFENEPVLEREVAATTCVARTASERDATMRGARQGTSSVTDGARSIGTFEAAAGTTFVACTRRAGVSAPDDREFVVAPGAVDTVRLLVALGAGLLFVSIAVPLIRSGWRGRVEVLPPARA